MKKILILTALILGSVSESKPFSIWNKYTKFGAIIWSLDKANKLRKMRRDLFNLVAGGQPSRGFTLYDLANPIEKKYIQLWSDRDTTEIMLGIHGCVLYVAVMAWLIKKRLNAEKQKVIMKKSAELESKKESCRARINVHLKNPQELMLTKEFNQDFSSFSAQEQDALTALSNKIKNGLPFTGGGIILYGKPGTGKSYFCATLSILTNIDQLRVTPDLIDSDCAIEAIKDICKEYSNRGQKLLVTFEEGELFIKERENVKSLSERNLLSRILMELETVIRLPDIYCALNTNYPWELGEAGIRAGRFGGMLVEFNLLNKEQMVDMIMKALNLNESNCIERADIAKLIKTSNATELSKASLNNCLVESLSRLNFNKQEELQKLIQKAIESAEEAKRLKKRSFFQKIGDMGKNYVKNLYTSSKDIYYQNETIKSLREAAKESSENKQSLTFLVHQISKENYHLFLQNLKDCLNEAFDRDAIIKSGALNKNA